jgi:hypothetical protein
VQRSVARSAQDQKSTKCRRNPFEEFKVRRKNKYRGFSGRNPSEEEILKVGQDKGLRFIQEEPNHFRPLDLGEVTH